MTTDRDDYESSCTCAVCMEDLGTDAVACPCGHVYHADCIRRWMCQQRVCPQCKACAVPLTRLKFNLFTLCPEEKSLSTTEVISALQSEHMAVTLSIDNELAEINILEPQLAEAQEVEKAYLSAIEPRRQRKDDLETRMLAHRGTLFDLESTRKQLQQEFDFLREKLLSMFLVDEFSVSSTVSRRPIAQSEIPKIMTFLAADSRKQTELKEEKKVLESQLSTLKQNLNSINNTIRSLGAPSAPPIVPSKTTDFRVNGFVPMDSFGIKRKREEQFAQSTLNRRPQLLNIDDQPDLLQQSSTFDNLSALVSILSDDDEDTTVFHSTNSPELIVLD